MGGRASGGPLYIYIQMLFLRKINFLKIIFRKINFPYQIPDENNTNVKTNLTKI